MKLPKVTVGLCVRNSERTIKEALNCVLNQDFPHEFIELIIVDGLSKDKTVSIIKDCLRSVDIETNFFRECKGLGYARQIVIDRTHGKYIVWVDGDMILPQDFVRKQVEFMEKNPDVGIGKGKYGLYDTPSLAAYLENVKLVMEFVNCTQKTGSKPLGTAGCIYRVDAIKEAGGFDKNIKGVGEDMDAENKVRNAGWLLCVTPAMFYETRRQTWGSLWNEYYWHGQGGYYFADSNAGYIRDISHKMFPISAMLNEFKCSIAAYKKIGKKAVFLLPFHYFFKRIAWVLGFLKAHNESN